MAKNESATTDTLKDEPAPQAEAAPPAEETKPVEFVEPSSVRPGPTIQQQNWMSAHPEYAPMAHASIKFTDRGTLQTDGVFVPEEKHPPMDGGGAISVGIPVSARRR